jgi:outer membrane protein OmpA-like peptidoglycan-associated protein
MTSSHDEDGYGMRLRTRRGNSEPGARRLLTGLLGALLLGGCAASTSTPVPSVPTLSADKVPARSDVKLKAMTPLNSSGDDFGLTMPVDSTIVFFTAAHAPGGSDHDIYFARRTGATWTVPAQAVEINNGKSNGVPSITPGAEALYFAGCDYGLGDCDLYRVDVGPRGEVPPETIAWTIPNNLGLAVNGPGWESQPCISADGSTLYFSSDRPGGFGGKDIWLSKRLADGSWDRPINAGPHVNTAFDEVTPWIAPDGKTLLFSSNGRPGLGGFDVFEMHDIPGGGTVVNNLGTPVNSSADEISFSLSSDGRHAFVASNRDGGAGGYDLYEVAPVPVPIDPFVIVRGRVRDETGHPVVATVSATDLAGNTPLGRFTSDPDSGTYTAILPRGYSYALTADAPGHLFYSKQLTIDRALETTETRYVDFQLAPMTGSVRLLLFFDPGESNLQKESVTDLNHVIRFLQENPTARIEISGHTDNTGDEGANFNLSTERARAVKSYLVGNRISADRIEAAGYGPKRPIADNTTEAGRAMNRRVEMRIVP